MSAPDPDRPLERRPLASRETAWARALAARLARTAITPNRISIASMAGALVAGGALWASASADGGARVGLLLLAAAGCQFRLLCNLMDGMVAIESGKGSATGPFWNEFPDRISDALILGGLGAGAGLPLLGCVAAIFAVMTAYLRELGRASGLPADYSGPMGKPQRMAAVTLAALIACIEPIWGGTGWTLAIAVAGIAAGTALTVLLRARRLIRGLAARGNFTDGMRRS